MSNRYGSLPGVTNHYGATGLGVLGSVIRATTATGEFGAGYLYNDLSGADDAKEIRGLIVTPPAAGTFIAYEDGSFSLTGVADGTYSFVYRLYADGADLGTATATVTIGAAPAGVSVTAAATITHSVTASAAVTVADVAPMVMVSAAASITHAVSASAAVSVITPAPPTPSDEPVTLAQAKLAARIVDADASLDLLITGLITSAREQAEQITGRLYHDATERIDLADWPAVTDVLPVHGPRAVAISYWDGAAWADLAGAAFAWAPQGAGTIIAPAVGSSWPALGEVAIGARVRVTITGGLADPSTAPESVKLYIKALVSVWINNPDAAQRGALQVNPHFERLLDPERLWL